MDKNAYHFSPNNTYLTAAPAAMIDHASAATAAATTEEGNDADGLFEKGTMYNETNPSLTLTRILAESRLV